MVQGGKLVERYRGCLLGLACGDALGGPVEFTSREEIAARFPDGLREFVGGGWLHLAPGEITDDTQMTLALARAIGPDGLDMATLTQGFLAWYHSEPKDIGNTTRAALAHLADGMSWDEAGAVVSQATGERGAGNGAVMRCAPVALRYRRDRQGLIRASIDSARITHDDRRCTWSAVAVNQALVHLLEGGATADVLTAAVDGVEDPDVRAAVLGAADRPRDAVRSGGFVLETVGAALWCLLHQDDFEETVVAAVGLGADADTTGAVAGALAGARYGMHAIPARWRDGVQHREKIVSLADRLLGWS